MHSETARRPMLLCLVTLAVGFILRAHLALTDDGIYWPDEIYQSLEPAHRLAFGHGLVAWEFIEGARNQALPLGIAAILKVLQWMHLASPSIYLAVVKVVFATVSTACGWGIWALARSLGATPLSAAVSASVWALGAPFIYFAPRAMSENASALPLVWGFVWLASAEGRRRHLLIGASLIGCATLLRLQCGYFAIVAVFGFLVQRRFKDALWCLAALAGWALIFGACDAVSWGHLPQAKWGGWFHSAVVYLRFNVIENKASLWGTSEWNYYALTLRRSLPVVAVLCAMGILLSLRRVPFWVLGWAGFGLLLSAVPHKEYRFVLPLIPLLLAAAAVGLSLLQTSAIGKGVMVTAMVASAVSAAQHRSLTFGDLGAYAQRADTSAYDDFGHVNRLLLSLSQRPDVCGVRIDVTHLAWSGGSSYLHRPVPIYPAQHPTQLGHFNYAITWPGSGAEVVSTDHGLELVKLAPTCIADPHFDWQLH
jgi:GPI mannosyltransferase 3